MSESRATELLAFDLADRLHKALRLGRCKPGEMRRILGVSESTMTNYLNGTTRPKDGMLRQWAMRCGGDVPVTFDWLAYGIEAGPDDGPGLSYPPRDSNPEPAGCAIYPLTRTYAAGRRDFEPVAA